ncbi:MAG: hypothetical protein ACYDCQ_00985 [Dehalococcoidia bacterium]
MTRNHETDTEGEMGYEVWDLVSGNALTDFSTEAQALEFVRKAIDSFGREHVYAWGLSRPTGAAVSGAALIDLALEPANP